MSHSNKTYCPSHYALNYLFSSILPETEFSKGLQRLYQSCKHSITHVNLIYFTSLMSLTAYLGYWMLKTGINLKQYGILSQPVFGYRTFSFCVHSLQPHMPLFSIYSLALEQDQEQSVGLQQANATLHNQTFIQVNFAHLQHEHFNTSVSYRNSGVSPLPPVNIVLLCVRVCPCSLYCSANRSMKRDGRRSRNTGFELRENWYDLLYVYVSTCLIHL